MHVKTYFDFLKTFIKFLCSTLWRYFLWTHSRVVQVNGNVFAYIYISLGQIDGSGTHSVFFLGSKIENSHLNITRFKPCYMWLLFFFYCDTIVVVWGFKETERKTFPTTARTFGWFFDQYVRLFLLIFLMIFSFVVDKKIPLWSVHVARNWITSCTTMNSNVHACLKSIQLKSANNYQPRLRMRINFTLVFRK